MRALPGLGATCLGLGLACGVGYKPAVDARQLAESDRPHTKIVDYLSQTAADPAVCDLSRRDGLALAHADARVVRALHAGLEDGAIPPDRWATCALHLWREADQGLAEALTDGLLRSIDAWVARGAERPGGQAIGESLLDVLDRRASTEPLPAAKLGSLSTRARAEAARRGADSGLGDLFARLGDALDLESGLYEGRAVDSGAIASTRDERLLQAWALRHPDPGMRARAGRRLVDLRVEGSPFAWVRANPDAVRAALASGPLGLPPGAVLRTATWRPTRDGTAMLRVLQEPRRGKVRLLPAGRDGTRAADPSVDLVGSLWFDVEGLERPVSVCAPASFDPVPCVPPGRLALTHPIAALDPSGRLIFPTELDLREFIELGRDGDRLAAQIVVDGLVASVDLPIQLDSVPELVLFGPGGEGDGPDAQVEVWELSHGRLLFEVESPVLRRTWTALVEPTDAAFSVRSHGVAKGSEQGRGGDLRVRLHCTDCPASRAAVERMVRSTGQAPGKVVIRVAR